MFSLTTISTCPKAATSSCATITKPHVEQCEPFVKPDSVHVAATASSITTLCPNAATSCWSTRISSHTEQCEPSVKPFSVHVGATAASTTTVCPNGEFTFSSLFNSTSHTLQ